MTPEEALARALRGLRASPNTEAAGWRDAEDAAALLRGLRAAGWDVRPTSPALLRVAVTRDPPPVPTRGWDYAAHVEGDEEVCAYGGCAGEALLHLAQELMERADA